MNATLVTKADLLAVKSELKADIVRIENRIDLMGKDMQAMEQRLTIKLGAFIAFAVGTTAAIVKLL